MHLLKIIYTPLTLGRNGTQGHYLQILKDNLYVIQNDEDDCPTKMTFTTKTSDEYCDIVFYPWSD